MGSLSSQQFSPWRLAALIGTGKKPSSHLCFAGEPALHRQSARCCGERCIHMAARPPLGANVDEQDLTGGRACIN